MVASKASSRAGLTARGRATRDRIVESAAELMFRHGVNGTSLEDVRRAAGVSGSQLTHYFRDKQALVRAVIAHRADAVVGFPHEPSLGPLDSFEALRRWAEWCVARQHERGGAGGCVYGSLAGQLAESDEATRGALVSGYERWCNLLEGGLAAMRERGELRPEAEPRQLALALLAAHQGGSLLAQVWRSTEPLEAALDSALARIRALGHGPSTPTAGGAPEVASASAAGVRPARRGW